MYLEDYWPRASVSFCELLVYRPDFWSRPSLLKGHLTKWTKTITEDHNSEDNFIYIVAGKQALICPSKLRSQHGLFFLEIFFLSHD